MNEDFPLKVCFYDLSSLTENAAHKFSNILMKENSQEFSDAEGRISLIFGEDRDSKTSLGLLRRFIASSQMKENVVYISKNHTSSQIQKKIAEIEIKEDQSIGKFTMPIIVIEHDDTLLNSEVIMDIVKYLEGENVAVDTLIIDSIGDMNTVVETASKFAGKVHFIADFDYEEEV